MSGTPEEGGRVNQKRRTRAAIVAACQGADHGRRGGQHAGGRSRSARLRADRVPLLPGSRLTNSRRRLRASSPIRPPRWRPAPTPATRSSGSRTPPSFWRGSSSSVRARSGRSYPSRSPEARLDSCGRATASPSSIRHSLLSARKPGIDAVTREQLRRDLAVVISAEAVLTLTDLYGLDPDASVASIVHTARLITEATLNRAYASQPS